MREEYQPVKEYVPKNSTLLSEKKIEKYASFYLEMESRCLLKSIVYQIEMEARTLRPLKLWWENLNHQLSQAPSNPSSLRNPQAKTKLLLLHTNPTSKNIKTSSRKDQ